MHEQLELIGRLKDLIEELRAEIVLLKSQLRVEGAIQEISVESLIGIDPNDYGIQAKEEFVECPDCQTRWLKSHHENCPLCWQKGLE